jgi:hypothetical protein
MFMQTSSCGTLCYLEPYSLATAICDSVPDKIIAWISYLQILNLHSEVDWSSPFALYAAGPSLESAATVAFLAS